MSTVKVSDLPEKATLETTDRVVGYSPTGGTSLLLGSQFIAIKTAAESARDVAQAAATTATNTLAGLETAKATIQAQEATSKAAVVAQQGDSINAVKAQETASISAVNTSKTTAVNAIKTQQNSSVGAVQAAQTTATDAVGALVTQATTAKETAVSAKDDAVSAKNAAQTLVTGFDTHVATKTAGIDAHVEAETTVASYQVLTKIANLLTHRIAKVLTETLAAGTAFTVPAHTKGGDNLLIFVDGVLQHPVTQYTDESETAVKFASDLAAGKRIVAVAVAQDPATTSTRITESSIDTLF